MIMQYLPLPGLARREVKFAEYISLITYVADIDRMIIKNLAL